MIKFNFSKKTKPMICYNVGSFIDIPTGNIVIGARGESIINGGVSRIFSILGSGNNYKSLMLYDFMLSAANNIFATHETSMSTYDTEVNISLSRLENLASKYQYIPANPVTEAECWSITDKSIMSANTWSAEINQYIALKAKDKKSIVPHTAFIDPYTKKTLMEYIPSFTQVDSLSTFEGEASATMLEGDLEDSSTNTFAMKQGLFKHKFLSQLPRLSGISNTIFMVTTHIGTSIDMATGPAKYQRPSKQLQYLKPGDKLKGVPGQFNYLINGGALFANTATKVVNRDTKLPEYPRAGTCDDPNELNAVKLTQLRGKNGPSGFVLDLLISQYTGIEMELSQFNYIKERGRFGMIGNNKNYRLALFPGVNLSRTTVRDKIHNNPLLAKAVQFTSDLLQLRTYHSFLGGAGLLCTPEELYDDIIKLGYDWNVLLDTRSWWAIDQYSNKIKPFLTIVDLLKMRVGIYKPYWLKDKK